MTYQLMAKEFPDYDQATLPAIPDGWTDTSWHNDTCPSFFVEDAKVTIYIDYPRQEDREFSESLRYTAIWSNDNPPTPTYSLESGDWQEVLDLVNERACPMRNQGHRDTGRGVCAHCGKVLA